jgi:hypothetical protein
MWALPRIIRPAAARGGIGYDADAQAYFNAMSVQPDATRKGLINDYIVGLKADGVWSLLDLVYILASHDSQAAGLNAKTPASNTITVSGTITFTTDRGYGPATSAGAGLDTNFNPATAGGNWTQNSASLFSWVNSTISDTANSVRGTIGNSASTISCLPRTSGDAFTARANAANASTFGTVISRLGSRCLSRTASTTTNGQVNGAASGSTSAVVSTAVSSQNVFLLRQGASSDNDYDRLALATLGGGLTSTQMTALHNRSSTFLTAIGAN